MADKTKLQISEIRPAGFVLSLFASGKEADGTQSEINGTAFVIDCTKAVDFSVWKDLAGSYLLASFDGVTQNSLSTHI